MRYLFELSDGTVIDGARDGNDLRHLNHSCQPNCEAVERWGDNPLPKKCWRAFVERVTCHDAENGVCVLRIKARGHRDRITVIGQAAIISPGEWVTAPGNWFNDHTHGQQFKARFMRTSAPTSIDSIEKYLGSGMIRGMSATRGHTGLPRKVQTTWSMLIAYGVGLDHAPLGNCEPNKVGP